MFWAIAIATNVEKYDEKIESIRTYNNDAYMWIRNPPQPKHWCKASFYEHTKCDTLVNSMRESFRSQF